MIRFFYIITGDCESHNPCQHLCFDLHDGTFECACRENYFLSDNGYSCISYDSEEKEDDDQLHPLKLDEQSDQQDDQQQEHHLHHHHNHLPPPHKNLTPQSRQLSSTLTQVDEGENHLFSHSSESEDEDVDLDQFSSANSKMFFMEKRQGEDERREEELKNLASFRSDTQNTDPSSLRKKSNDDETTKSDSDKLNGRSSGSQIFNSCSEIECEAGGICVTESTDTSSSPSSFYSSTVESTITDEVTPVTSSSLTFNLQSSRLAMATSETTSTSKTRVRCRCPLGRKGSFCEKRKSIFSLSLTQFVPLQQQEQQLYPKYKYSIYLKCHCLYMSVT